jgi:rod shape-determining protein MreC
VERGSGISRAKLKFAAALALVTLGLCLVPSAASEKAKLSGLSVLAPIKRVASWIQRVATRTAPDPAQARRIEFLERKLAEANVKNKQLESQLGARRSMEDADLDARFDIVFADVIVPADAAPWRSSLTIAKGSTHGVRTGQIVVYGRHLVGRIHQTAPFTARVLLTTDPAFKIGALVMGESSQVGIAQGGSDSRVALRWVAHADIRQGQQVITAPDPGSGTPKGLLIGRVLSLDRANAPRPHVLLEPPILPSSLDYVMILCPKEGP